MWLNTNPSPSLVRKLGLGETRLLRLILRLGLIGINLNVQLGLTPPLLSLPQAELKTKAQENTPIADMDTDNVVQNFYYDTYINKVGLLN